MVLIKRVYFPSGLCDKSNRDGKYGEKKERKKEEKEMGGVEKIRIEKKNNFAQEAPN